MMYTKLEIIYFKSFSEDKIDSDRD